MQSILDTAKDLIKTVVREDSIVADCTMGNGGDTLFLSSLVPKGHVYAFDIQPEALISTEKKLRENNSFKNVTLINSCHSKIKDYIHENISAAMFNLGWLPNHEKIITTKRETTLPAIKNAMDLLEKGGMILIVVYPGHEEGRLEGIEIEKMLASLNKKEYDSMIHRIINVPECPYIMAVQKR